MPSTATFAYFAYGSNLDRLRLHESCPSAQLIGPARLPGHRLAFTRWSERWQGGVADVRPSEGAAVWGVLWEIDNGEVSALDRQEGLHLIPPRYARIEVMVQMNDGGERRCWSYRVAGREEEYVPSGHYLEMMLRGARAAGLPAAYVAALTAIQTSRLPG